MPPGSWDAAQVPGPSAFIVVAHFPKPLSPSQVEVEVGRAGARRTDAVKVDRRAIWEHWDTLQRVACPSPNRCSHESDRCEHDRTSTSPTPSPAVLYNGLKFRLHSVDIISPPPDAGPTVKLRLGITDYKSSVGTTLHVQQYPQPGTVDLLCGTGRSSVCLHQHLANALGVEALVVTADLKAVMFRRSQRVLELPEFYACPGGHTEPSALLDIDRLASSTVAAGAYQREGAESVHERDTQLLHDVAKWFECVASRAVARELFTSVEEEVEGELGISRCHMKNEGLLGIVLNEATLKPDACFYVQLTCHSEEVRAVFDSCTAVESFESDPGSLLLIDLATHSTPRQLLDFLNSLASVNVTPASMACLLLGVEAMRTMGVV